MSDALRLRATVKGQSTTGGFDRDILEINDLAEVVVGEHGDLRITGLYRSARRAPVVATKIYPAGGWDTVEVIGNPAYSP